ALAAKYKTRTEIFRSGNFLQFQGGSGGVFLRCVESTCLTVESATRETFDRIDKGLGWTPAPAAVQQAGVRGSDGGVRGAQLASR
ncbi:MAG: hypothetical protein WCA91_02490, partial [Candidatus Acidiferrales bacterium]